MSPLGKETDAGGGRVSRVTVSCPTPRADLPWALQAVTPHSSTRHCCPGSSPHLTAGTEPISLCCLMLPSCLVPPHPDLLQHRRCCVMLPESPFSHSTQALHTGNVDLVHSSQLLQLDYLAVSILHHLSILDVSHYCRKIKIFSRCDTTLYSFHLSMNPMVLAI